MTEQEFRIEMDMWVIPWKEALNPKDLKEIGQGIFEKFLKGRKEISKSLLDEFAQYSNLQFISREAELFEMQKREEEKRKKIIKRHEADGMLFMKKNICDFTPLMIHVEKDLPEFLEVLSAEDDSFEQRYKLFKIWLFNYVVRKFVDDEREYLFVEKNAWNKICVTAPKLVEALEKEGKEYYKGVGYLRIRRELRNVPLLIKNRLAEMTDEEKAKIVAVRCNGSTVKVVE